MLAFYMESIAEKCCLRGLVLPYRRDIPPPPGFLLEPKWFSDIVNITNVDE